MNPVQHAACALALLGTVGLATSCPAQGRTFLVDASNGVGTDFTDLPPAMAQAEHGDVYLVRAGNYSAFRTSKGVAILGQPGAVVAPQGQTFGVAARVEFVPAGQTFIMRGIEVQAREFGEEGVSLNGVGGAVHLEEVVANYVGTDLRGASFATQACAEVSMTRCRGGYSRFANSRVWLRDCELRGRDELASVAATAALIYPLGSGGLNVAGGTFTGGNSTAGPPGPGAHMALGEFLVTGNATTDFAAGVGPVGARASAIEVANGTLTLDPRVVLRPTGGAPPVESVAGTGRVVSRRIGYLQASAAVLGGTLSTMLHAQAGDLILLGASRASGAQGLYGMQTLVDLRDFVGLAYGSLTSDVVSLTYAVPVDQVLVGRAFALQAAVSTPSWPAPGLSNPAVIVVGR